MRTSSKTEGASSETTTGRLACCHGFAVAAGGRSIGIVETPVFVSAAVLPTYLIVRTGDAIAGTFRVVPLSLVEEVDVAERLIVLGADADAVAALPEQLPLERR